MARTVLTFLMTDVAGSTRLWEEFPQQMNAVLERHDAIIFEAVSSNGGTLIRSRGEGDSSFSVFQDVGAAMISANQIQSAIALESWPPDVHVAVRIAVHTGEAEERAEDYYGPAVNRCARLRSVAHGGQSLISQSTFELVRGSLPVGSSVTDLGLHRLRDLARPEHVYQLETDSSRKVFPRLPSLDIALHNLPIQLTSFVGRERELAEVGDLFEGNRLITLTGAGGSGKSRLALQVAAEAVGDFSDGVWLADLSHTETTRVWSTICRSLELRRDGPANVVAREFLRSKDLLLLLDNCEHVLEEAASVVEDLLDSTERLRIIVTAREPLGVSGETVQRIPPLGTEPTGAGVSDAVRLFIERAREKNPRVSLDADAEMLASICRRLDGMPLAIELAAARVSVLPVDQIAARLDDRFALLTSGSRTALPRQQTLRATVDWSYAMLSDEERALLRALSIFSGPFDQRGVEAVFPDPRVLELLARLADKSLVSIETSNDGPGYLLSETIREYARIELEEAGDSELVQKLLEEHLPSTGEGNIT